MRPFAYRLSPACLLLATIAHGETVISTTTAANVRTSTAAGGSADDVTINSAGTVSPSAGTGVTIDSNNSVNNAGTIAINNVDNSIGVAAQGSRTGTITNSGTIRIDDAYAATDTNGDTIIDGAFATGTGRYGIRVGGTGAFVGNIINSGTIAVEGNNSAGIYADVPITGSLRTTGTISVLGDNGYGIRLGAISGTVTIAGAVSATGQNSVALALTGDVGGALVVHSAITSTGYSSITVPTDTSTLLASNLLQGGSALSISGNVAGGVLLAAAPTDTTNTTIDADADGVADASEGTASVTSYGAAPALLIGSSSQAITIGLVSGATSGFVNNGVITGRGLYSGVDATAVQIAGLGQTVTLTGGFTNTGTITANSAGGHGVGFYAASGAIVPSLTNSGTISGNATTISGGSGQGVLIASGASLPTIANSGTISTVVAVTGGIATAILDRSGTLTSVSNSGTITASDTDANARAIDVSANTSGFTYTQALASSTATAPLLSGAILTGGGNDLISASAGTVKSAVTLGAGDDVIALSGTAAFTGSATLGDGNDSLTLADTSSYTGTVDFGAGNNILRIGSGATFSGQILNSASNIALTVASGGTANFTTTGAVALASLSLGGTLGVTVDPDTNTFSQIRVAGTTAIASGATLKVSLSSIGLASTSYTVLTSGSLSGSANLGLSIASLPYLLSGILAASDTADTVVLNIGPKNASTLGFNRSETAAYSAVFASIAGNSQLSTLFLGFTDRDSTLLRYRQMLPDHEGGVFDLLSNGARVLAPGANAVALGESGDLGLWAQQAWWNGTQDAVQTAGYHGSGYGLTAGADVRLGGFGRVGISFGYLYTDVKNVVNNSVSANDFQGGVHWIGEWGGFRLSANGAAGAVRLNSVRNLSGTSTSSPILLTTKAGWGGLLLSGNAAASYEAKLGALYLRPAGTLNYARLREDGHSESGGGSAYDLIVAARKSSELSATGTLTMGVQFGHNPDPEAVVFRIEAEGGRRQIVNSNLGATTAQFAGGTSFTLLPEDRQSGYVASGRLILGSSLFNFSATAGTEIRDGYRELIGRLSLRAAL